MNRKKFLSNALLSTAGICLTKNSFGHSAQKITGADFSSLTTQKNAPGKMKVCIFSKQLQWLSYEEMAAAVAEMGFDGIDLTVRPNGHVLPERVEEDLPKAVAAAHKAGIKIQAISTDIQDARQKYARTILKTASGLGINLYRSAGLNYQKGLDVRSNLENIKAKFESLAAINKEYNLHSDYLNHSGENFGASLWDLWFTIKDIDPKYVGSQLDINHATVDGLFSWPVTLNMLHTHVHSMVVRDFKWEKINGAWEASHVPLGEGMVDFKKFFGLVKQYGFPGPIVLMCDYDLGGAETGKKVLTKSKDEVLGMMKKDLLFIRNGLAEQKLI